MPKEILNLTGLNEIIVKAYTEEIYKISSSGIEKILGKMSKLTNCNFFSIKDQFKIHKSIQRIFLESFELFFNTFEDLSEKVNLMVEREIKSINGFEGIFEVNRVKSSSKYGLFLNDYDDGNEKREQGIFKFGPEEKNKSEIFKHDKACSCVNDDCSNEKYDFIEENKKLNIPLFSENNSFFGPQRIADKNKKSKLFQESETNPFFIKKQDGGNVKNRGLVKGLNGLNHFESESEEEEKELDPKENSPIEIPVRRRMIFIKEPTFPVKISGEKSKKNSSSSSKEGEEELSVYNTSNESSSCEKKSEQKEDNLKL